MTHDLLAVDIGGSKFRVGVVSADGTVKCKDVFPWKELTAEGVVTQILEAAEAVLSRHPEFRPAAIGATIPGLADPKRGIWVEASFSGIRDIPLAAILTERFGLPTKLDNDGQACALAEKRFGAAKDADHFLYLTVSNGVGGAIWAGGGLYYGAHGNAGEIGHVTVVENGRPCKCGSCGCLEMYAAGPGVVRNYLELGGSETLGGQPASAELIAKEAEAGEPTAVKTFELEGLYLGRAVAAACNLLNPEKVILGGGVSLAFSLFGPTLRRTVDEQIYRGANPGLTIIPTPLFENGGMLAAAALAVEALAAGNCESPA